MDKKIFLSLLCGLALNFSVPAQALWLSGYEYRKEITIDHTKIDSDLSYFPLAVMLSDTTNIVDGNDVKFTLSDGETKLDYEMESYATDNAVYWVNIPIVLSGIDTKFYVYYGKAGDTDESTSDVWDSNYKMVQHLEESGTGTRYDSTANNNDGSPQNYDGDEAAAGKIDGADSLDGTNDSINFVSSGSLSINDAVTVEAWVYPESSGETMGVVFGDGQYEATVRSDNRIRFTDTSGHGIDTAASVLNVNEWNHIVCVFDGTSGNTVTLDNTKIYVNGVSEGATVVGTPWSLDSLDDLEVGKSISYGNAVTLFNSWNTYSVLSGATRSQDWTVSGENTLITELLTYHWHFGSGGPASIIYIKRSSDNSVVWSGMSTGGTSHYAYPNIILEPGTYYCTDNASTWSYWWRSSIPGHGTLDGFLKVTANSEIQALYDGIIDEVRISDIARSEDWITASYYSESNNLITFGNEASGVIPEPTSLLLLGLGVVGIAAFRKRLS